MKTSVKWILGIFMVLSFSINGFAEETTTIRLTNGEWAPWLSQGLKHYGVASHIVTEAFALEGVKVIYEFFPWARAKNLAQFGDWDGSVVWYYTAERAKYFNFSDPVVKTQVAFFHLKSFSFDWNTMEDLYSLEIGGVLGVFYSQEFAEAEKAGKFLIERVPTHLINIRKLLKGRIKIMPMEPEVAFGILRNKFNTKDIELITHHPKMLGIRPLHVIFSKKIKRNKRMITLFNNGLKRLKESGKYDQFIEESQKGNYILKK